MDLKSVAMRIAAGKPLSPEEKRKLGKANVFLMDFEMDGGTLPPEIEALSSGELDPDQARTVIRWAESRAPEASGTSGQDRE